MTLQGNTAHFLLSQHVAHTLATFDGKFTEILVEEDSLQFGIRFQSDLDNLCLTIRIGGKVEYSTTWFSLGQVVLTITSDAGHVEPLDETSASLSITINSIVDGTAVCLSKDCYMDDLCLFLFRLAPLCLTYEKLVGNMNDLIGSVPIENNHIIDIRTIADVLILLQTGSDETFLTIDVELLIGFHNLDSRDSVKALYLSQAGMILAILFLNKAVPVASNLYHVIEFLVDLGNLIFDAGNQLVSLVFVELQDTRHLDFHQTQDVVLSHFAYHLGIPRSQPLINPFAGSIHRLGILELLILVYAFLDEYFLQGCKMQALQQLAFTDETLLAKQFQRVVHTSLQHFTHGKETRFLVIYHTTIRRNADLAISTCIEGVDCLVRRGSWRQVNKNLHTSSCQVLHVSNLDLTLLVGFQDTFYERTRFAGRSCRLPKGYLCNGKGFVIPFLYFGTDTNYTSTLAIVVATHINTAASGEIWIKMKFFTMQILDSSITDFVQVMRQNLARQAYRNAFGSLSQKKRKFYR